MNKAVFLDRDGTLNRERGDYTFRIADFEILPGVPEVIAELNRRGYKVIIITNQGGIAKGMFTARDVDAVHDYFRSELKSRNAFIDDIYFSPNHDHVSKSLDRKPGTLMFEKAVYRHHIDPARSFMIGDSERDVIPARKMGIEAFLITANTSIEFILNHAV